MNCAIRFVQQAATHPQKLALWTESHGVVSYEELNELATRAQAMLRSCGVGPGTPVVIAETPGPALFATLTALLALGAPILFIEPWLSVERVEHVIREMKPQVFFTGFLGKLWGLRVPAIRKIPHWKTAGDLGKFASKKELTLESLDRDSTAIIAFSSGTTGKPKGSIRSQGYLWDMHEILVRFGEKPGIESPDLAVFPNVALFQLGTGRGAVLVPGAWNRNFKGLARIAQLPKAIQPETLTSGPAFLNRLLSFKRERGGFESLREFHIGGALTDCRTFEDAFAQWQEAHFTHVYGGSEAEPVALSDARLAVEKSRALGHFQTLSLGRPVEILQTKLEEDALWVSGPNVSPEYWGDPAENAGIKRRDEKQQLWHCMGDRVQEDSQGSWWYAGRQFQSLQEFQLEQKVYSIMQNSAAFVVKAGGQYALFGETVEHHRSTLQKECPEITQVHFARIVRDRRHQARVDRKASLLKLPKKVQMNLRVKP